MLSKGTRNFWIIFNSMMIVWNGYWWVNDPSYAWLYSSMLILHVLVIVYWVFFARIRD